MKCRFTEADIALFVEGDLPEAKALEVSAHLTSCRSCAELASDLHETQAAFKTLKQDVVSSAALSAVRTRVLAEVSEKTSRPWWWGRWVYAVAGGLFVLIASVLWFQPNRTGTDSSPLLAKGEVAATVTESPVASADEADGGRSPRNPDRAQLVTDAVRSTSEQKFIRSVATPAARARLQSPVLEEKGTGDVEPKQIVVKLLTDDPNVVIYWLVEQTNGGTL